MTFAGSARVTPGQALARWDEVTRREFPEPLWVVGEVVAVNGSGPHLYLTLSDEGPGGPSWLPGRSGLADRAGPARLRVTALGVDARLIRRRLGEAGLGLQRGMRVGLYGHLRVWAGSGQAELRAIDVDTRVGVGAAESERRKALAVIERAGLALPQSRMGTPVAPLRVAVISPDGQGLEDFRARLGLTGWAWDLRVVVTPSEGVDAGERLGRAVRDAGVSGVDVVVVTRGGGAGSLGVYDEPAVIMAVSACAVPVIVAVGHYSDRPLAGLVAWLAEATPTAGAAALDRIVTVQVDGLRAEASGLVEDAAAFLAVQAGELTARWGDARIALHKASPLARGPLVTNSPAAPPVPGRRPVLMLAGVAVVLLVALVAVLLMTGVL